MSIVLSVATAAQGFASMQALIPGLAIHAACAVAGVQLVGISKKMKARRAEAAA